MMILRPPNEPMPTCGSTQDLCVALAEEGAAEGTVVWSLEQTSGRGRGDNRWSSPAGSGLWMSFVLRPTLEPAAWPALTPLVALSVADVIESLHRLDQADPEDPTDSQDAHNRIWIKWPNDLLSFGIRPKARKLAGILAQAAPEYVVIGVGINVFQTAADFPKPLRETASSLRIEGIELENLGDPGSSALRGLIDGVNESLTARYHAYQNGDRSFLKRDLLERFYLRGARVAVGEATRLVRGDAVDIGPLGELVLQEAGQPTRTVVTGGTVREIEF